MMSVAARLMSGHISWTLSADGSDHRKGGLRVRPNHLDRATRHNGGDNKHIEKECDWSHKSKLGQGLEKDEVG